VALQLLYDPIVWAIGAGVISLIAALMLARMVLRLPAGNDRMQSISLAIRQGAMAYLNRQFRTIFVVGLLLFVVFILVGAVQNERIWYFVAASFAVGALFSALAAYLGMSVSVRSNSRTAQAAQNGLESALLVAFRGGAVNGFGIVGLALIGVAGFFFVYRGYFGLSDKDTVEALVGFAFGASLISIFARVGGGI
jgi:K(+)-stimulated pyrophosphate-energized sodium pump